MLYALQDVLSKDNLKSGLLLTVAQFHFKATAYWCMLQTIVDRTLDVFCGGVILETIYCMLYIVLSAAKVCFGTQLIEKGTVVEAPAICKFYESV